MYTHTDPRLLTDADLLAEHEETHRILALGWWGPRGQSLYGFRHEVVRVAMSARWGVLAHGSEYHPTPITPTVTQPAIATLTDRALGALLIYERQALMGNQSPAEMQEFYRALVSYLRYPPNGPPTPWHAAGITPSEYLRRNT